MSVAGKSHMSRITDMRIHLLTLCSGLAGTVLVYKIAGALAKRGGSLDEVYKTAEYVSSRLATIGVGLEHCHVPGTAAGATHLKGDEIEIGMGIHNESGAARMSPVPSLKDLTKRLLDMLLAPSEVDSERGWLGDQLQVCRTRTLLDGPVLMMAYCRALAKMKLC